MNLHEEIPQLKSIDGWKEHPILFEQEELVRLKGTKLLRLILSPQYYLQGIPQSQQEMYVRKTVKEKLLRASSLLPEGYSLVVWDTWRPYEVQKSLFDKYIEHFQSAYPFRNEQELIDYTQTYVSLPSKEKQSPSPHSTGGAVDVTIADLNGNLLNMGTGFDEMTSVSATRYFEEKLMNEGNLSEIETDILLNRRLLFHIMSEVGFTNYKEEWWHYDYGNQFWGIVTGEKALYGEANLKK